MMRPVAIRKASATVAGAKGGMVAGRAAGTGIGSAVGGAIGGALGSVIPGAGTAAGAALGSSLGGAVGGVALGAAGGTLGGAGGAAVDAGKAAKTVGVKAAGAAKTLGSKGVQAGKEMAVQEIGQLSPKQFAGQMAQQASANHAAQKQQTQQNNIESATAMADKAKETAEVTKAWSLMNQLQHPEYADFTKKLFADAQRVSVKPSQHWDDRMGNNKSTRDRLSRYKPKQEFLHRGERVNVEPFQVAHAMMDRVKHKGGFDEHDEDDRISLDNLLRTDDPHENPADWNGKAEFLSPVMVSGDINHQGITAIPDASGVKDYKTHSIDPMQFATTNDIATSSTSPEFTRRLPVGIVNEHLPGKRAKVGEKELVDSFSSKHEDDLQQQYAEEDKSQAAQEYRNQRDFGRRQKEEEAARQKEQAQQEAQARQEELANKPPEVTPAGPGMWFVNGQLVNDDDARASGYIKSEPIDLAWRMLFKAGIEVHHQEPLPEEFTQDLNTLDKDHQMNPTENGTMIDNISPHMLRTIELMAQNYKEDESSAPKPFVMPSLRH